MNDFSDNIMFEKLFSLTCVFNEFQTLPTFFDPTWLELNSNFENLFHYIYLYGVDSDCGLVNNTLIANWLQIIEINKR